MNRHLDEVVASQKVILRRRQEGDRLTDEQLMASFDDQRNKLDVWIRAQENFTILNLNYDEVVADPARAAADITNFLGLKLDVEAMAQSVNPSLYRNRSNAL